MEAQGLRNFITLLQREGLLQPVTKTVDWKYEIGEISRRARTPLLFQSITGYPGCRLFTNGLVSSETIALALGLDRQTPLEEAARIAKARVARGSAPAEECQESATRETATGDEVDLLSLPVPWWSPRDGGRFLGTWHVNVTRDPETGARNVGVYRMMVLGRNTATLSIYPRSHIARHIAKAEELRKPLEMAVAIGVDERLMMAAAAAPPYGVDEYVMAGALAEQQLAVGRCTTVALEVPCDAEIVIEGLIEPGVRVADGPFFDYAGISSTNPRACRFHVTAIRRRENAIFRGTAVGRPGAEDHVLYSLLAHMDLFDFHGSRAKRRLQKALLERQRYRLYQLVGRLHS